MKKRMIMFFLWMVALVLPVMGTPAGGGNCELSIPSFNMAVGETFAVDMSLKNDVAIVNLQADLGLPAGLTLVEVTVLDRATEVVSYTLQTVPQSNGTTRLLCASYPKSLQSWNAFTGTHGPLLRLTFEASATLPYGTYEVPVTNIFYADSDGTMYEQPTTTFKVNAGAASSLVGDINQDGSVDVSDVTALVSVILGQTSYPENLCDISCDSHVDVSDVTALVNIILTHQ